MCQSGRGDVTLLTNDFWQDLNCFWDLQGIDQFPQMGYPIQLENLFLQIKEVRKSKWDAEDR